MVNYKRKKGQSIIELLITIALSSLFIPILLTSLLSGREGRAQQEQRLQALTLLKEGQEVVRTLRDNDWSNIENIGIYHPLISGPFWSLETDEETIDGFRRRIEIADTNRDSTGKITNSDGTPDPSTKKITTTVYWDTPSPSSVSSVQYLTRHTNLTHLDTTISDFGGTSIQTGVAIQAQTTTPIPTPNDGQIVLGAGGNGNWCAPETPVANLNLTGQGEARGIVAYEDRAFVGTGQNASGHAFYNITINNSGNNPSPQEAGIYDDNSLKTNDVFGESHYAYLATDKNSAEVVILDVQTSTPTFVAGIDTSGPTDANTVFVSGTSLFVATDSTLYRYDITNRSSPQAKGQISLVGTGNKIYVVNNYVYVALGSTSYQLEIIDANDPNTLQSLANGKLKVADQPGISLYVNNDGSRTYLVTSQSASQKEFYVIDSSDKSATPTVVGSYDTYGVTYNGTNFNMNPKGITLVTGNKAIIVGNGTPQYQVVELNDLSKPCGSLTLDSGTNINGVWGVLTSYDKAYSHIITTDASAEYQIIEGGPGGEFASSGTFESDILDFSLSTNKTAFNRIIASVNEPASTTIKLQVASKDAISCSGISYTYIGPPDPNNPNTPQTDTFYTPTANTINGLIPYSANVAGFDNPGKCFRYKVFFDTSDSNSTPILYDVTINYSP